MGILPKGKPAKMYQDHKMRFGFPRRQSDGNYFHHHRDSDRKRRMAFPSVAGNLPRFRSHGGHRPYPRIWAAVCAAFSPCFLALFFHSRDESDENFRLLCSRREQSYTIPILEKPMINGVFEVIHPYSKENHYDNALAPEMPDRDECIQPRQTWLFDASPKFFRQPVRPRRHHEADRPKPAPTTEFLPANFAWAEIRSGRILTDAYHCQWKVWQKIQPDWRKWLHKIIPPKSGKFLDKSRFHSNKSLQRHWRVEWTGTVG